MKYINTIFRVFFVLLFSCALLLPLSSKAQIEIDPNFNPHKILEDSDLLDCTSMSLSDIQSFLQSKNSYLANYLTPNNNGVIKSAAEIIFDAARNNFNCDNVELSESPSEEEKVSKCQRITTVSPKFLLVLLQKEASLIEDSSPTQARLDWATGYGCPDNWACNPYYKGFGKQINSAALQFLAYMNEQSKYKYQAGGTYNFTNPYGTISTSSMTVTLQNKATAALYNYTPHVFNGNYNVFKLWNKYFSTNIINNVKKLLYPNDSLLSVEGDPGIWLIENGKKRPFLNYSAFISRFSPEQVVKVLKTELDNYPQGDNIKFANYSLVQTPDKNIYLLVGKEKQAFTDLATFKKIGFNPEEIEKASEEELANYQVGKKISATSTYVTGALLQDTKTGGVYYVENGTKAPLLDKILLSTKFKGKKIIKVSPTILEAYTKIGPVLFDDGTLVKTDTYPIPYLISDGEKRQFADEATFIRLGYNPKNVISVSSKFLYNYPNGEIIK